MNHPPYTAEEARNRETFLALMNALSTPGRVYALPASAQPVGALMAIAHALLDLETSYHTPDPDLQAALARTGARALPPEQAAYHFYRALTPPALDSIALASAGTMLYPDTAATLMIAAPLAGGAPHRLTGAGVNGALTVAPDLPAAFWALRDQRRRYPLGWDAFIVEGLQVIGLPRTTHAQPL